MAANVRPGGRFATAIVLTSYTTVPTADHVAMFALKHRGVESAYVVTESAAVLPIANVALARVAFRMRRIAYSKGPLL